MLAIRQLDVAIRTGDPRLALTIAARLDTTGLPVMAQVRARIYTAAAHGLAGHNRKAARIVAETVCMAPQLTKDPVVQRLLKTFCQPSSASRRRPRSPATS